MSRITYGTGSLSLVLDDQTAELVRRAVDEVAPGVLGKVEDAMRQVYGEAFAAWPVGPERRDRNGVHSRDRLGYEVRVDVDGTIRGRVFCTASWARYIKPKGLGGKSAFVWLLRRPFKRVVAPLNTELMDIIRRSMEA